MHIFCKKIKEGEAETPGYGEFPLIIGGSGESQFENLQFTVRVSVAVCVSVPLEVDAVPVTVTVYVPGGVPGGGGGGVEYPPPQPMACNPKKRTRIAKGSALASR